MKELEVAFSNHTKAYANAVTNYMAVCEKYGSIYDTLLVFPTEKQKREQDEYRAAQVEFGNTPYARVFEDLGMSGLLERLAFDLAAGPPYQFGRLAIRAKVQEVCLRLIESDHEASLGNINSAAYIQHEARCALDQLLAIHEKNYFVGQHSPQKANGGHAKARELQEVKNEVIRLLHDLRPEQGWESIQKAADAMRDRLIGEFVENTLLRETQEGPITLFQRNRGITEGLSSDGMERTLKKWMGTGKDADAKVHAAFEATKASKA
ncbi:hypothetical protein GCM10009125_04560 [Castellaniella daejeonensis]|uniref:Uncharacterized protein n=2 Tax=Castellaniella daejeonensis TaxID=659013 RepID=A0ABN0TD38_9BURK